MTESNTFKHLPESDRRTLVAMGDVETVDLLTFDVNGQRRGKRIAIGQIDKIYRDGFFMPYSVYALDIGGGTVDSTGYGLASGDRDALCRPVPGSLRPVPWLERPGAQVLFEMYGVDGRPFTGNPRAMLAQVVGKLASAGLHPVAALEYEFYLLDKPATDSHQVRLPLNSRTGARAANTEVYSLDELDNQRKFISDACRYARTLGINAESVIAEYAPGQFEINLTHSKDIVAMCDQMIMLKQAIKSAALDNNMCATFMAKPYPDLSGSGAHIHLSINDTTGHNVFSSGTAQPNKHELASTAAQPAKHELAAGTQPNKDELAASAAQPNKYELAAATQPNKDELAASAAQPNKYELAAPAQPNEQLAQVLGGLAATMRDFALLFAPHPNSYRRFQEQSFAPLQADWAYNNRSVAFRLPVSDAANRRVEHRIAGADANPYLLMAAVLAGALHGINNRLEAGPPAMASPPKADGGHAQASSHAQASPPAMAGTPIAAGSDDQTGSPATAGSSRQPQTPKAAGTDTVSGRHTGPIAVPQEMSEALEAFATSEYVRHLLDPAFVDMYTHIKRAELAANRRIIPPAEYECCLHRA